MGVHRRKRPFLLSVDRQIGTSLRPAAVATLLSVFLASPAAAFSVTMPGGPTISVPNFHYTPPSRPSPPPYQGPSGPSYTPPPVYQPSPAELQQQRATAINEQGIGLFRQGNYAAAIRLFQQALAMSTNSSAATIIQRNIGNSYSWLTSEAQERGDLEQALRYIQLARQYYPDESDHDWPGWEQYLRDKIQEQREAAAEAERERQEQMRTLAANAEQERTLAREHIKEQLAAEAERQRAEVKQKIAEAEKQRAEAKQKIAEQLAKSPFAKTDRVAPIDVPPPHLDAKAWSKTFASEKTEAAFQLSQSGFDKLREAKLRAADWISEQAKEKGKDKAIETIMEHLPFSEAINREIEKQHGLIERYKELYDERSKSATEYVTGFFDVVHDWVACEGGVGSNCAATASAKLETVSNKYKDQEGGRFESWLLQDLRERGTQ
jgi:tetratricopeptide (TPR) repeat protein